MNKPVYIVYSNLFAGGIPAKIIDIANTNISQRHTILYILLQKKQRADLTRLIRNENVRVVHSPSENPILFLFWVVGKIIQNQPISILTFISSYAIPVLLTKILFFPSMKVIVSEDHYTKTMINTMTFSRIQRLLVCYLYPRADIIFTPTKAIKKMLVNSFRIPRKMIQVVPNWTRFANIPIHPSKRTIDIIHIGRLVPTKNPMKVLKNMHTYIQRHPKAICAIIGDGTEKQQILDYLKTRSLENRIRVLNAVHDVSRYLLQSKVFLFLPEKKTEGFPIILLDAMACGTLVVTSRFDGIEDVIHHNINGIILATRRTNLTTLGAILGKPERYKKIICRAKDDVTNSFNLSNRKTYISALFG